MPRLYKPMPHRPAPARATWVVAADAGRARIFEVEAEDGHLNELADLLNPEARLQDHEAFSDRRGEVMQGSIGVGHSLDPHQSHHQHIAEAFAKSLAQRLNSAHDSGEVARIHLLAEPHFLGLLRRELRAATQAAIVQELARDFTRQPLDHICEVLSDRS